MDRHDVASKTASLRVLGISEIEEAVYRALLRHPGSSADALAQSLSLEAAGVEAVAVDLERKGFATHAPGRVRRLFATPPDIAVEALLLRRQNELQAARQTIASLQAEKSDAPDGNPVVEIIDSTPAAQAQPYAQSHRRAVREVLCLVRPPFLVSTPSVSEDTRAEARKRGVKYRNIVHPDTLEIPGWPEIIRQDIQAGEEVRILRDLPFKMIVADKEVGLLPLKIDEPYGPIMLLRRSSVLDALCELFESLWTQAMPTTVSADGSITYGAAAGYSGQLTNIVPLFAAGLNDKAIAERLGISHRTLMRRIDDLYQELGAKTRFQAGWLAARQSAPET